MFTAPNAGWIIRLPDGRQVFEPVDRDRLEYLLNPEEVLARSYSQWIALRSGSSLLRQQLDVRRRSPYPEHWDDDDFEQIAEAFDALFESRGWKR